MAIRWAGRSGSGERTGPVGRPVEALLLSLQNPITPYPRAHAHNSAGSDPRLDFPRQQTPRPPKLVRCASRCQVGSVTLTLCTILAIRNRIWRDRRRLLRTTQARSRSFLRGARSRSLLESCSWEERQPVMWRSTKHGCRAPTRRSWSRRMQSHCATSIARTAYA